MAFKPQLEVFSALGFRVVAPAWGQGVAARLFERTRSRSAELRTGSPATGTAPIVLAGAIALVAYFAAGAAVFFGADFLAGAAWATGAFLAAAFFAAAFLAGAFSVGWTFS